MKKISPEAASGGFTLLELLLSMAITTIIVVMVFGIFRVGIRAWERGERDTEKKHRLRIVSNLIQSQLRSITLSAPILKKDDQLVNFDGDARRLTFVSKQSLDPDHNGQDVLAGYIIESDDNGDQLYLWELPMAAITDPIDVLIAEPDKRHVLLSAMQSIRFQFLIPAYEDQVEQWEPQWESTGDHPFPKAVGIRIMEPDNAVPIQLYIPLQAENVI